MQMSFLIMLCFFVISTSSCATPKIRIFDKATDPLKEFVIEGRAPEKILVIPVRGMISDAPSRGLLMAKPSLVQEIVSQLRLAEKDSQIGAVILKIDSPGGSTTASDILYNELIAFKTRTGKKIVAALMGMATSGGYYIALPADRIVAHPTTVTGSIGVLFMGPKFTGLMGKLGVNVEVVKSGTNKDMGSPFRDSTQEEIEIVNGLINNLADRFTSLVTQHRDISQENLVSIACARVYLAQDALELGLIDKIGYLDQALADARDIANLPDDSKVVMYRRTEYHNDNIYNTATMQSAGISFLSKMDVFAAIPSYSSGFYYLWTPGTDSRSY